MTTRDHRLGAHDGSREWRRRGAGSILSGLVVSTAVSAAALEAQSRPVPVSLPGTVERVLHSDVVGVDYKLYVSLPNDYAEGSGEYAVLYLLDADYSFAIARNIVEHLSDRDHLERLVIVGIGYDGPPRYRLNRTRDYTPTPVPTGGYGPEYQAVSGGASQFKAFIADELIPFIDSEYRTTDERALVGHSYGGLFASWVLMTDPDLFDHYVIVSPSLWYDDHLIFDLERARGRPRPNGMARVFMSVGDREVNGQHDMPADLRRFAARLDSGDHPNLRLRWSVASDETHNSIFPRALSDGLRWVFEGN